MSEPGRGRPVPTLATVAHAAGVSRQTVSNALNSPELLRPETLARVQRVIAEVGYAPNRAARNLRTRRAQLVGLRFDPGPEHTADALIDRFVHTLVDRCAGAGLHVLLFSDTEHTEHTELTGSPDDAHDAGDAGDAETGTDDDIHDDVAAYAELWRSGAVDAFVLTDTYRGNPQAPWLEQQQAPFVAFGRPWDDPTATHRWVDVDGAAGTALATDHLRERGHARIAWLGLEPGSRINDDRRSGWRRAMTDAGLPTAGRELATSPDVRGGREAAHRLLDADPADRPTGLVCVSDTVAVGVVQALHERGLRAGEDLAVVGFDDSQTAQLLPGGLTSVRQPLEEVAVELVAGLGELLALERPRAAPSHASPGVLLTPRLVVRGSTGG